MKQESLLTRFKTRFKTYKILQLGLFLVLSIGSKFKNEIYSCHFSFDFMFSSCKEESERKTKPKITCTEKLDLTNVPDSLRLITDKDLIADFTGDDKADSASIVENKNTKKIGVLIINNLPNQKSCIFGAGNEIDQMTDLNWIEVFKTLPKGTIVSPTLIDEKTGDLLGKDKSKNFKLLGNGIYMSVKESHGGGILFWDGEDYQWYHIE